VGYYLAQWLLISESQATVKLGFFARKVLLPTKEKEGCESLVKRAEAQVTSAPLYRLQNKLAVIHSVVKWEI
jgi:hypothetical protein